jgi:hypothetical protein
MLQVLRRANSGRDSPISSLADDPISRCRWLG